MNKSRLIWGIICLLIAGGLTIANLSLPPEDILFQVGNINMPWVPPTVFAIIGIVLLATSVQSQTKEEKEAIDVFVIDPEKATLNKHLETIAWGCFLIMLGGFMFVPEEFIASGWWPVGVGLIMLGLNGARYFNGLKMSGFTTFLGVVSVIGGVLNLMGIGDVDGAVLLVVLGCYLILKPYFDKQQLFGKAEHS